ncbi:acyl-phosphate glycerol 3-phosphate acyltransferase [Duganella sp. Leaf126]|uniref:lysophospholipid acyltransferase family protein n=1 Tax=Duganella sp. Leaf126 TaxID=1736266 RepID=UPI0006F46F9B|nr:lysophospholipid acyltransferase family protein [Duganella sp. Leaf126]KQQ47310.1 acyl-phosphate glycerol 3-phosphate acyltransferase [Duganella sp. Leaf126]
MTLSTMVRLARVLLHVLQGMAICAVVFPWLGPERRNDHIRRWSHQLLALCKVTVVEDGGALGPAPAPVLSQAMVVANHVSWLDIFVIHSLYPSHFVAKAEIRSWPLAGWLAQKAGTVFIARGQRRDLRLIFEGLVQTLQRGERVAFFPEGTTAAQGALLPFHANLFEAAIDASVPVQPFALRYVDAGGALHRAVDFIGEMTFAESIVAILSGPPVTARVAIMPAIDTAGTHRRDLAQAAQQAVAAALGVTVSEPA